NGVVADSGDTDVASQQTITAIGGAQQNPCGSTAASLLFVNSNDWGSCAGDDDINDAVAWDSATGGTASGAGSSDLASQQTITAIGGAQQNPCGSTAASLLFVSSQDFGTCGGDDSVSEGPVTGGTAAGAGSSDLASQQTVTLVGGA